MGTIRMLGPYIKGGLIAMFEDFTEEEFAALAGAHDVLVGDIDDPIYGVIDDEMLGQLGLVAMLDGDDIVIGTPDD